MAIFYLFGKRRLFQGQPFLAVAYDERLTARGSTIAPLSFDLHRDSPRSRVLRTETPVGTVVAIPTQDLPEGSYQLTLRSGDEVLVTPENVWILSREHYAEVLQAEAEEEFISGAPIPFAEVPKFIENIVRVGVETHYRFPVRRSGLDQPSVYVWGMGRWDSRDQRTVDSTRLRWLTEALVEQINYTNVLNTSGATNIYPSFDGSRITLAVQQTFNLHDRQRNELLETITEGLLDREVSDLYALNARGEFRDFAVRAELRPRGGAGPPDEDDIVLSFGLIFGP